jgi:hypothetical protein
VEKFIAYVMTNKFKDILKETRDRKMLDEEVLGLRDDKQIQRYPERNKR